MGRWVAFPNALDVSLRFAGNTRNNMRVAALATPSLSDDTLSPGF